MVWANFHKSARMISPEKSPEWLAAERGFGTEFLEFVRLSTGNSSMNFRATTADGRRYFVKFAKRRRALEKALAVEAGVRSPLVGCMAFGGRSFESGGCFCFAFDWIDDVRSIRPRDLTARQIRSLADAYGRLSDSLKDLDLGTGSERPIHGDLHYDNVFFRGDDVVAFIDFEMMRRGLPTEDLVRIFAHRLERTRFWNVPAFRRLYAAFGELVGVCPYSKADWLEAIDRAERKKRKSRLRRRRLAAAFVASALTAWIYRGMRRCVG